MVEPCGKLKLVEIVRAIKMNNNVFSIVLMTLLISLVVFLIARELICWYWKINHIVSLLESIDSKLNLDDRIEQIQIALDKIEGNSILKTSVPATKNTQRDVDAAQ